MALFKRNPLFQTIILGIHVSFRGCKFQNQSRKIKAPFTFLWESQLKISDQEIESLNPKRFKYATPRIHSVQLKWYATTTRTYVPTDRQTTNPTQWRIFHPPRFPWKSRGPISLPKRYLFGSPGRFVTSRANLTKYIYTYTPGNGYKYPTKRNIKGHPHHLQKCLLLGRGYVSFYHGNLRYPPPKATPPKK